VEASAALAHHAEATLIPFLLTESDLINTVPRARASIQCRRAPLRSLFRIGERLEGSRVRSPFLWQFLRRATAIASGTRAGDSIADPPRKMDHESVTIHFPLGNYVIKMISGDSVMDDPPMNVAPALPPPPRRFLEYARNVP